TGEDHEVLLLRTHAGYQGSYEPRAGVRHWLPRARLVPSSFRRWVLQNGRDVARLEALFTADLRRWLGLPRYLWRQAARDAAALARAALMLDARRRFGAALRLIWFAGYLRESWLGSPHAPFAAERLALRP